MNNDKKNNEESFENSFFTWLDRELDQPASPRTGEMNNPSVGFPAPDSHPEETSPSETEDRHSLDDEDLSSIWVEIDEPENSQTFLESQSDRLGDIPTVQQRFYEVLKRRLKTEIQQAPPLFPWETEMLVYDAEVTDAVTADRVPSDLWLPQLQNLKLPVPLPQEVFKSLLTRCQQVVNSSLLEGSRLVDVVTELFPDRFSDLNYWTEQVLIWETDRGEEPKPLVNCPTTYETANPTQQMVLSLLAAREILGSLTLRVSASHPRCTQQWSTAVGPLTIEAQYKPKIWNSKLRIQVHLPQGGNLQIQGDSAVAHAQRPDRGTLSVELFDIRPDRTYSLEIALDNEASPFLFVICPTA
ncbi:MAG: hypothetical protein WBB29_18160 [Geitlerinemataceae cyanobacterium]